MTGAPTLFDVAGEHPSSPAIAGPRRDPTPPPEPEPVEPEPVEPEHQDDHEPAGRSYRCPTCAGRVSPPTGRRNVDLAAVRRTHEQTCPGRTRGHTTRQETNR